MAILGHNYIGLSLYRAYIVQLGDIGYPAAVARPVHVDMRVDMRPDAEDLGMCLCRDSASRRG